MRLKNSNIDWVGAIPEEWEVTRLKNICPVVEAGKRPPDDAEEVFSIGGEHIQDGRFFLESPRYVSLETYKQAKGKILVGDVLVVKDGATIGKCMQVVAMPNDKMLLNEHVYRLPIERYYYYWLKSTGAQCWFQSNNMSTAQESIPQDTIYSLPILIPPERIRECIVAYLDEKTAAIDARVVVLEKKLAAYKRLKTSVINHAVTRGLDPKAQLKDSGVDWIGKVPAGWEVKNFTHCCQFFKGLAITKADLTETGTPVISYGQIHSKINTGTHLKPELLRYIPEAVAAADPGARLKVGDIVFADTSEDVEGCGNCVLMDAEFPVYAGYHAIVARPDDVGLTHYLSYLFNSPLWRSQIRSKVAGIKVFSVTQRIFKGVSVLLPSVTEASAIADYLDAECAKIDKMAALVTREIELYKKLKRSLINEVVTGKRPVFADAPPRRGKEVA